ncbi:hypothetical protein SDRG_07050 [Saprolegnia diclina VS20]|uniref:F-box domain-containing protein n=1 Tax=Saprolegnia diclina (strain VS20) TaxID=1156394 RepID=T0RS21_SAPDV|nr:hypothetical protein SDRG_07050 [Saprolegnia diclina VS20]EQC35338.1 hypothetical protein SDRG_07050 [Saprolegnia diclina VS20]|eukprot:XP_008611088.1 hypothetical protein SDRG_07050 [Saprolegnia diclina VS20]
MAVVHAGVLSNIVQYVSSSHDVLSLLDALPRDALDTPLRTLQTLVSPPVAAPWPHLCVDDLDCQHTLTLLAALSTFCSVSIENLYKLTEVLRDASSEPESDALCAATIDFARKWGHKVTHIAAWWWPEEYTADTIATIIRHCTGLNSITHAKRIVYASSILQDVYDCGDWRHVFGDWLASAHATELRLDNIMCEDSVGFARAIAAATSLTSLKLTNAPVLLQGLVEAGVVLQYITQLRLVVDHSDSIFADALVSNGVNLPALRVLKLRSEDDADMTFVLRLLPYLVALERRRRRGTCDEDDDVCLDLFAWAERSPCLEVVNVDAIDVVWRKPVLFGRQLRRWIQSGVDRVSLEDCDVDDMSITAIAGSLCDARRSRPFVLYFRGKPLRLRWYYMLIEALATSTGVSIEGNDFSHADDRHDMENWATRFDLRLHRGGHNRFTIHSPV